MQNNRLKKIGHGVVVGNGGTRSAADVGARLSLTTRPNCVSGAASKICSEINKISIDKVAV